MEGGGSVYHMIRDQLSSVQMDEPEGYYCHFQRCCRTPSQSSQKCGINVQSNQLSRSASQSTKRNRIASQRRLIRRDVPKETDDLAQTPKETDDLAQTSSLWSKLSSAVKRKTFCVTCRMACGFFFYCLMTPPILHRPVIPWSQLIFFDNRALFILFDTFWRWALCA